MRRLTLTPIATLALTAVLTPALVVLPTMARPAARPRPVAPRVQALDLHRADPTTFSALAAPGAAPLRKGLTASGLLTHGPALLTPPTSTRRFDLVAVSWSKATAGTSVEVRVREGGSWTRWQRLDGDDDGPDQPAPGKQANQEGGASAPLLTGGADGVQVRVDSATGTPPPGFTVDLVDGGQSAADAGPAIPAASAEAATPQPKIITRAQWGADESLVTGTTSYDTAVKALFVHHTDTTNSYSATQAYAQMRAIYAFHTKVRGWNDIGYNFLVDRFGRVFEGRRGSITRPVVGAHTGGFNSQSLGVAVLGTFTTQTPAAAALRGLVDVLAWKAAQYGLNPRGSTKLISAGGPYTRHPAGASVPVTILSSHRDVGITECPGDALYAQLPWLRRQVAARMKAGLVAPTLSAPTATWSGTGVTAGVKVTGSVPTRQTWTLSVTPACATAPIRVLSGTATSRITASWDLRTAAGTPAVPGLYHLTLATRSPVGAAPSWSTDVEVLPTDASPAGTCPVRRVAATDTDDAATRTVAVGRVVAPGATTVVLAGLAAAGTDGVVGAPLAHALHAPLLLTDSAGLSPAVAADVGARHVTRAVVVGGPGSVAPAVVDQLRGLGVVTVERVAGSTGVTTAVAVASKLAAVLAQSGSPAADTALLAPVRNRSLADVATLGALGAATGRPILLLGPGGAPSATLTALRSLRITRAVVAASAVDVPSTSLRGLAAAGVRSWTRSVGTGRAGTALVLARLLPPDPPTAPGEAWAGSPAGTGVPDVVAANAAGRPVILLPAVVTAGISAWFETAKPSRTWVLGGTAQVPTPLFGALTKVATPVVAR
jgi:N-acetylmuramoyl-L-alanine amidase-like protein/putative cell wall binding repeat protein